MSRQRATNEDPRGIIAESYVIDDLTEEGARSIFLDWAMMDAPDDPQAAIATLLERFRQDHPDHPMTKILAEGALQTSSPEKRQGRRRRD